MSRAAPRGAGVLVALPLKAFTAAKGRLEGCWSRPPGWP